MTTNYLRDRLHRNQMIMPWVEGDTISTIDAASMMQCSGTTVRTLLEEGKIKGYRIKPHKPNSPWRVYRKSVEQYIARVMETYALESAPQAVAAERADGFGLQPHSAKSAKPAKTAPRSASHRP